MGNKNSSPEKVIRILKGINITTKYTPFDFTSGNNYATFELATTEETAKGLEKAVNSHFSNLNGNLAQIRIIGTKTTRRDHLYEYVLEIVPDETMNLSAPEKERETQKLLDRLPKELKNYLRTNKHKC